VHGALVHGGVGELSALLASQRRAGNLTRVVAIQRQGAATVVRVEDTVIPPHVARTLELLLESLLPALERVVPKNASAAGSNQSSNASHASAASAGPPARRLLLFRELVLAVEERVKNGWTDAGRLHEAFAKSIEQVLTWKSSIPALAATTAIFGSPQIAGPNSSPRVRGACEHHRERGTTGCRWRRSPTRRRWRPKCIGRCLPPAPSATPITVTNQVTRARVLARSLACMHACTRAHTHACKHARMPREARRQVVLMLVT
jgi:hypothetical protein